MYIDETNASSAAMEAVFMQGILATYLYVDENNAPLI